MPNMICWKILLNCKGIRFIIVIPFPKISYTKEGGKGDWWEGSPSQPHSIGLVHGQRVGLCVETRRRWCWDEIAAVIWSIGKSTEDSAAGDVDMYAILQELKPEAWISVGGAGKWCWWISQYSNLRSRTRIGGTNSSSRLRSADFACFSKGHNKVKETRILECTFPRKHKDYQFTPEKAPLWKRATTTSWQWMQNVLRANLRDQVWWTVHPE